jgi:hypothetical protein
MRGMSGSACNQHPWTPSQVIHSQDTDSCNKLQESQKLIPTPADMPITFIKPQELENLIPTPADSPSKCSVMPVRLAHLHH